MDLESKMKLTELLVAYDDTSVKLSKGLWIGAAYRSFDVGYVGMKSTSNYQIKQTVIR